ncbi:hypothetical protein WA577_001351, partial [Blastocystis sp. JDR]
MKRAAQKTMDSFFKAAGSSPKMAKRSEAVFQQDLEKHIVSDPPFKQSTSKPAEITPQTSWIGEFHSGVPGYWGTFIDKEATKPYFKKLLKFLQAEEKSGQKIFPPRQDVFNAFTHCQWENVKVVIIGQDPYHDDNQAHGMCFSVNRGVAIPPSLRNIYQEIKNDLGIEPPKHGNLLHWADQGVLLLNTVLTVRAHKANSHAKQGWETFTDAVIEEINSKKSNVVFLLWGNPAQKKGKIVDRTKHYVLESVHPSPLSAFKGATFFNHHHFSLANAYLKEHGME